MHISTCPSGRHQVWRMATNAPWRHFRHEGGGIECPPR